MWIDPDADGCVYDTVDCYHDCDGCEYGKIKCKKCGNYIYFPDKICDDCGYNLLSGKDEH